jgi:hypothetical protein
LAQTQVEPAEPFKVGRVLMAELMTSVQRGFAALMCTAALLGCAAPDASRGEVGRYKLALPEATRWTEIPVSDVFQAPPAVAG